MLLKFLAKAKELLMLLKPTKKMLLLLALLIVAAGLSVSSYYLKPALEKRAFYKMFDLAPKYAAAYSLVDDTISQSSAIVINLPPETTPADAQAKIKFTPEIKGAWQSLTDEKKIVYQPKEKLKLKKHYSVSLTTAAGTIGKDFLVEEDPQVVAAFPAENSEANEKTEVTIIFNRPIVPLSTIDAMADNLPNVEITPATKGHFKWSGSKTLQFIPDGNLKLSSNYSVKINPGFKALDGLEVPAFEHKFFTRPLRYANVTDGQISYNQPISIRFNMNVDLAKTTKEIWLKNTQEDKRIDFITEYGTKSVYNEKTKKYEEQEDRSVINVYNKADRYGRAKFWDFKTPYFLMIQKAYPEEGDIVLDESRETSVLVDDVIANLNAESQKTAYASLDYFDPDGDLAATFYEEVDLNKIKIGSPKQFHLNYGEKCQNANDANYYSDTPCQKIPDQKKIIITFEKGALSFDDKFDLNFQSITNIAGLQINRDPITYSIHVAPKMKILSATPADKSEGASLTDLYLCSNSQLAVPDKKNAKNNFKANQDFEFNRWDPSYLIADNYYNRHCPIGQFQTFISWGLSPESDYNFTIQAADVFGNGDQTALSFKTGAMPDEYLMFYHFQNKFNVTTPDKTSLAYATENMEYIEMNICQLSGEAMLKTLSNPPKYWEGPETVSGCTMSSQHRIILPKKFWLKDYFKVNLKDYIANPLGSYILTFTNPGYKEQYASQPRQVFERTYLNVTNLSITKKEINIGDTATSSQSTWKKIKNFYWVADLKTLNPVASAKINLFESRYDYQTNNSTFEPAGQTATRSDGTAEFTATSSLMGAVVTSNNDSAVIINSENNLNGGDSAYVAKSIYMYTDRPIYRPGNTVHIKGIYRVGYDGNYEVFRDKKINLKIFDSSYNQIAERQLDLSDFGTYGADFDIDAKAPLGTYSIQTDYGSAYFDVEEYVPAPFKVETKSDKEEYISGDNAELDVQADYYFGTPLEGGDVEYSVASQSYYFDKYQDEYFNFGSNWYSCWYDCSYNDKFILRNKVSLDSNGHAHISQNLDFKKLFADAKDRTSRLVTVSMTVKNPSGQSISAQKSFIVHAGEYYLGLKTDKSFLGKDEKFNLKAKTVDTNGKPKAVDNITLSLNKVSFIESKRQEVDGAFYYHWEEKLEPISSEKLSTDGSGNWNKDFSIAKEGEYRIVISGTDSRGNDIKTVQEVYVYGEGYADVEPSNDNSLDMIVSKSNLNVGDTAEVIIKSPFKKAKALISIERGKIFSYEIKDIGAGIFNYTFPIKEEYIPNIYLSATLISDNPDVRHGSASFTINTKEKELDIQIAPNKTNYLPGEEVSLNVSVKDRFGRPQETELSLAVADMSVLALKGNPKKNPVMFYYAGFPLVVSTASNLKNILHVADLPLGTKGGGGAESDDLARKKRGEFKDTAYWQAQLVTDKNGQANVKFKLPDNLTTWQTEAVGVTVDTKLGAAYKEFIAKKDLMITPLKPRFVVPGDEFSVGAKVFNESAKTQKLSVSISNSSLEIIDKAPVNIKVGANETQTVYFRVKAPANVQDGTHNFTLSAKNKDLEDTVEQTVSITRNTTYETTATAGYSKGDVNEYVFVPDNVIKDQGGLEIKDSATLAVFLSDGLNSLLSYPYGCAEQIASKLNAIAIVKKGLKLENIGDKFQLKDIEVDGKKYTADELVQIGLDKIYQNQTSNGSFTYYQGLSENYQLSLYIAEVFKNLQKAGYTIDKDRLNNLGNYLNNNFFSHNYGYEPSNDDYILAAYSISTLRGSTGLDSRIKNKIKSLEKNEKFLNEQIGNLSLTRLAKLLAENEKEYGKKYKDKVYTVLENRVDIDSRGAYLQTRANSYWQYYETSIKDTALLLQALVTDKRDNATLDRVLRWLLASRSKDGSWDSTNNTISVVDAMTDYIAWQKENKSDFNLKVLLNGEEKASYQYGPATILNQGTLALGLSDLGFNKLNAISFRKTNNNKENNNLYYDVALKYYLPANAIPPRNEGFSITRNFYRPDDKDFKNPIKEANVGDVLVGHITIITPADRNLVSIEDYIPAGTEIVNFNLNTESRAALDNYFQGPDANKPDAYCWECDYWSWVDQHKFYPDREEDRDDRLFLFKQNLRAGEYTFDYYVRVLVPGKFIALPATVNEMYFPENFGRTGGSWFVVNDPKN